MWRSASKIVPAQVNLCCPCSFLPGRATTVYLVQRRIDMLPKPLTEDICSLRWVGTAEGWLKTSHWVQPAII